MDEPTRRRSKHDDVPIIGDYSEAQNTRLRPTVPNAPSPPLAPRVEPRAGDDQWKLDPRDVKRHARLAAQRRPRGPLVKVRRYASIALVVAAGVLVYWNFETLRDIAFGLESSSGPDLAATGDDVPRVDTEPETVPVPADVPVVAPADALPVEDPAAPEAIPAPEQVPAPEVIPESPPPAPVEPETLVFSRAVNRVSEADAAAPVIVLRRGGNRGAATFTWWTSSGTARAGADYADLGAVVERFAAGQPTRTIRVPIVGDRAVEPPESFYVHLAPGERADASDEVRTEVVIDSDD